MANHTIDSRRSVFPETMRKITLWIVAAAVGVAVIAVAATLVAPTPPSTGEATLDRAAQVSADRLNALAEYHAARALTRIRGAESDRLNALAEYHAAQDLAFTRGRQADTSRLNALGQSYGLQASTTLTRAQQAEAHRLNGLAEHLADN